MIEHDKRVKLNDIDKRVGAKERFDLLDGLRNDHITVARECSALTVPLVIPPLGYTSGQTVEQAYQSHGYRLVTNMVSQLLLILFPPGMSFFKLDLKSINLKQLAKKVGLPDNKNMYDAMREAFVSIENESAQQFDIKGLRDKVRMILLQLVIAGTSCFVIQDTPIPNIVALHDWVCSRDQNGDLLEVIYRVHKTDATTEYVRAYHEELGTDTWIIDRYTERDELLASAKFSQEDFPIHCPSWNLMAGEDYGRGLVEENLGDLRQYESGSLIISQSSAALAKVIFLVNPLGSTDSRDVANAGNTEIISGNADDVKAVQANKSVDINSFVNYVLTLKASLDRSFMMAESIRRDAERVTAEEISRMANELEKSRGGVYGGLATTIQTPIARLTLKLVLESRAWQLTLNDLVPIINTGLQGLGRSLELDNTMMFLQRLQVIPNGATIVDTEQMVRRIALLQGLELGGALKSSDKLAAEAQQAMVNQQVGQVAPEYIKGVMNNG